MASILLTIGVGCDKTPINGPLDGQWQLMSIETPTGTRQTKSDGVYLCFQLHLCQWYRLNEHSMYSHFIHEDDSIRFYDFVYVSGQFHEGDNDEWITPEEMAEGVMGAWGIHSTDITYHVRTLNNSRLTLERADTVLSFRKF